MKWCFILMAKFLYKTEKPEEKTHYKINQKQKDYILPTFETCFNCFKTPSSDANRNNRKVKI